MAKKKSAVKTAKKAVKKSTSKKGVKSVKKAKLVSDSKRRPVVAAQQGSTGQSKRDAIPHQKGTRTPLVGRRSMPTPRKMETTTTETGTTRGKKLTFKERINNAKERSDSTQQRKEIWQAPHGIVKARAGTGKTFSSVLGVAYAYRKELWGSVCRHLGFDPIPSVQQAELWDFIALEKPRTIRYIAFNNSIVKAFSKQYAWLVQALDRLGVQLEFSTIHSMGCGILKKYYRPRWGSYTKFKTRNLLEKFWGRDLREVWKDKVVVIRGVESLVSKVKINLEGDWTPTQFRINPETLEVLATYYDIDLGPEDRFRSEIFHLTEQLINMTRQDTNQFDYDDQIWFPTVENLQPYSKYDLGIVDEGQDLNKAQQNLAFKCMDRIILVGDEAQAIYGFAGADIESMNNMYRMMSDSERGVTTLKLTVTRRCGKKIVAEAQPLVPDFEAHESNGEGKITTIMDTEVKDMVKDPDMVLCRVNDPLVALAFKLIREGRRCHIQGRELGEGLVRIIKDSRTDSVKEFLVWLDNYEIREAEKLQARKNVPEEKMVALTDKCACLRMFCEASLTIDEVIQKIEELFQLKHKEGEEPNRGVKLSSIHKAKGLEASRVFILQPEKLPHPMAKTDWAKAQEMNLKYVAITRAIDELVWVRTTIK